MMTPFVTPLVTLCLMAMLSACAGSGPETCPHCAASAASVASEGSDVVGTQPQSAFVSDWTLPEGRKLALQGFAFENQDGVKASFADLRGVPTAMSFIYTRCQNQFKCPLVAKTMAQLETAVDESNLSPKPRVLLITYDPEFDTPARLKAFGNSHGFRSDGSAMLLRPDPQTKKQLVESLDIAVNYNEGGVNLHGLQLILLDKEGRLARRYHSRLWDNADVMNDLARLAAE